MRRLRWESDPAGGPRRGRRPFRDSAILYGALAGLVVAIAAATGGGIVRAVVFAALFFVASTGYTWSRLRRQRERERRDDSAGRPPIH